MTNAEKKPDPGTLEPDSNRKRDFIRMANLSSVGIGLVVSTLIGAGAGLWLDKHIHTSPAFLLVGMLLGITAGFINIFRYIKKE